MTARVYANDRTVEIIPDAVHPHHYSLAFPGAGT